MNARVIREEALTTRVVRDTGTSGSTIMLMAFVSLTVIIIAVLLILHFSIGVA